MTTLDVDTSTKLSILKNSYTSIVSSFSTMCFQLGLDPFSIDLDTFVVPAEDATQFNGSMARQVQALKIISAQIEALQA